MKAVVGTLALVLCSQVYAEDGAKTSESAVKAVIDSGAKILKSTEAVGVKVLETGASAIIVPASSVTEAAQKIGSGFVATKDYIVFGEGEKFDVVDKALDGSVGVGGLVIVNSAEIAFLGTELALTIANNAVKVGAAGVNIVGQSQFLVIKGIHDISSGLRNGFHEKLLVPALVKVEDCFEKIDCAINEDWAQHDRNRDQIIEECPPLAPLAWIGNLLFKAPGATAKVCGGVLSVGGTVVVEGGRAINCVIDGTEGAVVFASEKLSEVFEVPQEGWDEISAQMENNWRNLRSDLQLRADQKSSVMTE